MLIPEDTDDETPLQGISAGLCVSDVVSEQISDVVEDCERFGLGESSLSLSGR